MVRVNLKDNEITVKIVYYGPGLSGKTTNLQSLHSLVSDYTTTELFSVKTKEDRTLFFDLMPFEFKVDKRTIKFKIYTVPGQIQYESTRKIVLEGADAVVFVADSKKGLEKVNLESWNDLKLNLKKNKLEIGKIPIVMQYNKRDLKDALPIEVLNKLLNSNNYSYFESIAIKNIGVLETFEHIVKETVSKIFPLYKITKNIWEIEQIIDEIENNLKPLYQNIEKSISAGNETGLIYDNVDINEELSGNLLERAIKATEETASLYSEIKLLKNKLEKKNLQLNSLLKENKYIKEFLESIFNQSGVPIAVCNFTGKIVNWNREMTEVTGVSTIEAKKMLFSDFLDSNSKLEFLKQIEFLRKAQKPVVLTFNFKFQNMGFKKFEVTLSPLKNLKNEVIAFSMFLNLNRKNNELMDSESFLKIKPLLTSLEDKLNFVKDQLSKDEKFSILSDFLVKIFEDLTDIKKAIGVNFNFIENEKENTIDKQILKKDLLSSKDELSRLVKNKKILIASDSKILLNNLIEMLKGSIITEAIEKSELVRHLNVDNYNFVLFDYYFPDLTGEQLYQWLYFEKPHILNSFIFLLPTGFKNEVYNFMEENQLNYIVKPITKDKILNSINKVLAGF